MTFECFTPPDYLTFLNHYLIPNRPCLIKSGLIHHWTSFQLWTTLTDTGQRIPNINQLQHDFGHLDVNVTHFIKSDLHSPHQPSTPSPSTMSFNQVLQHWNRSKTDDEEDIKIYIKDWHLPNLIDHQLQEFYNTPDIFLDDWINAYYTSQTNDDFRFVYMGEEGTFTSLHTDVYGSYSWSANICGQKRWNLYEPGSSTPISFVQSEGEVVFVPSGWKHDVRNLSPLVISINHNWCNAINLTSIYDGLCQDVEDVQDSIQDVEELLKLKTRTSLEPTWESEWVQVVQNLLKQHSGWNWITFWEMVHFIIVQKGQTFKPTGFTNNPALSPPPELVHRNVKYCLHQFQTRFESTHLKGILILISEIESMIESE